MQSDAAGSTDLVHTATIAGILVVFVILSIKGETSASSPYTKCCATIPWVSTDGQPIQPQSTP